MVAGKGGTAIGRSSASSYGSSWRRFFDCGWDPTSSVLDDEEILTDRNTWSPSNWKVEGPLPAKHADNKSPPKAFPRSEATASPLSRSALAAKRVVQAMNVSLGGGKQTNSRDKANDEDIRDDPELLDGANNAEILDREPSVEFALLDDDEDLFSYPHQKNTVATTFIDRLLAPVDQCGATMLSSSTVVRQLVGHRRRKGDEESTLLDSTDLILSFEEDEWGAASYDDSNTLESMGSSTRQLQQLQRLPTEASDSISVAAAASAPPEEDEDVLAGRRRSRAVQFEYPVVTSLRHRPRTGSAERRRLFFSDDELRQMEIDRRAVSQYDRVECVATVLHEQPPQTPSFATAVRRQLSPPRNGTHKAPQSSAQTWSPTKERRGGRHRVIERILGKNTAASPNPSTEKTHLCVSVSYHPGSHVTPLVDRRPPDFKKDKRPLRSPLLEI